MGLGAGAGLHGAAPPGAALVPAAHGYKRALEPRDCPAVPTALWAQGSGGRARVAMDLETHSEARPKPSALTGRVPAGQRSWRAVFCMALFVSFMD